MTVLQFFNVSLCFRMPLLLLVLALGCQAQLPLVQVISGAYIEDVPHMALYESSLLFWYQLNNT
jgi:hypothetical protein